MISPAAGREPVELSVIVPAFRHADVLAESLPQLVGHLGRAGIRFEVLVVDDGSNDGGATGRVAEEFGCAYLALPHNRGKGAAVRHGMLRAQGAARIFTDADLPFTLDCLDAFHSRLSSGACDVVVGDRNLPASKYFTETPPLRRAGSALYASLVERAVPYRMRDTQCGLKGFRGAIAQELFSVCRIDRFGFDAEVLYVAQRRGHAVERLPVTLRFQGPSSVRLVRDGLGMFVDLGKLAFFALTGAYDPPRCAEGAAAP